MVGRLIVHFEAQGEVAPRDAEKLAWLLRTCNAVLNALRLRLRGSGSSPLWQTLCLKPATAGSCAVGNHAGLNATAAAHRTGKCRVWKFVPRAPQKHGVRIAIFGNRP